MPKMMTTILVMNTDGTRDTKEFSIGQQPEYRELCMILKPYFGTDFEHVSVWASFKGDGRFMRCDMFVDENMHFKMRQELRNVAATNIYRNATMMGMTGHKVPDDPEELPYILGTAVLFDRRVWFCCCSYPRTLSVRVSSFGRSR